MTFQLSHASLAPHHKYQLEVIFLFIAGFFLFFPFYYILEMYHLNQQAWQWVFFVPWMAFYAVYSLRTRASIPPEERINPLKRPLVHWILLGLSIVFLHMQPTKLDHMVSIDIAFSIFSLFLADSYWDFTEMRMVHH
jgi:hypothetical protein